MLATLKMDFAGMRRATLSRIVEGKFEFAPLPLLKQAEGFRARVAKKK